MLLYVFFKWKFQTLHVVKTDEKDSTSANTDMNKKHATYVGLKCILHVYTLKFQDTQEATCDAMVDMRVSLVGTVIYQCFHNLHCLLDVN